MTLKNHNRSHLTSSILASQIIDLQTQRSSDILLFYSFESNNFLHKIQKIS
jgi:hypothetical protein